MEDLDLDFLQVDLTAPELVEVELNHDGTVLWVNVDGICRLRICRFKKIRIIDNRCTCGPDSDLMENLRCPIHGILDREK